MTIGINRPVTRLIMGGCVFVLLSVLGLSVSDAGNLRGGDRQTFPRPNCLHHGDVNLDGGITTEDAQMAFRIAIGALSATFEEECAADCDGNGETTCGDARDIFMSMFGAASCADSIPTPTPVPPTPTPVLTPTSTPTTGPRIIRVPDDCATIQGAINMSVDGDTILVDDGTYSGEGNNNIDYGGRAVCVASQNGPGTTIIDCGGAGRGVHFHSRETSRAVLSGFTIRYGYLTEADGGGILCENHSGPSIIDCIITSCHAVIGGGIQMSDGCSVRMINCRITGNSARGNGGGVDCRGNSIGLLFNCLINDNAGNEGGGVNCFNFSGLRAANCTIINNTAYASGGGACANHRSILTIQNSILWNNSAFVGGDALWNNNADVYISYSDLENGEAGISGDSPTQWEGMIDVDPLFVSGPGGDYYLCQTAAGEPLNSGCLDAGGTDVENAWESVAGMEFRMTDTTTRTDAIADADRLDLGFHHALQDQATATPMTPIPTETPHPPTATPEPTSTHAPPERCWDVTNETFALYEFEDNVVDSGVNNFHGTAHNAIWSGNFACGTFAYENDRSDNNYLEIPATVLNAIGPSWSIRMYFMLNGHGSNGRELTLLCHKNGINDQDLSIGESVDWTGCSLRTDLNTNALCIDALETGVYYKYELTYTCSDGMARVYLNDLLEDAVFVGPNPLSFKRDLYIGKGMFGNENRPWWGFIDHLEFRSFEESPPVTATPTVKPATHHVPADYATIQAAIDAAIAGDTVLVADGTYTGSGNKNLDYHGKDIVVLAENGPSASIIDCEGSGRGITFHSGESRDAVFSGFTILSGYTAVENGGAILCSSNSGPSITDCVMLRNRGSNGGAVCLEDGSTARLADCIISGNTAVENGGGVDIHGESIGLLFNCLIEGNSANVGGAVNCFNFSDMRLYNCTMVNNESSLYGGAITVNHRSILTVRDSILWENHCQGDGDTGWINSQADLYLSSSDVENGLTEIAGDAPVLWEDVIETNPLFVSGPAGDYYLCQIDAGQQFNSACLNAGRNPADLTCETVAGTMRCMDAYTTRSDAVGDSGILDLGFHHGLLAVATPTPATPTCTPTPYPPTATPTNTPTTAPLPDCWEMSPDTFAFYHLDENAEDSGPNHFNGNPNNALWTDDNACDAGAYLNEGVNSQYIRMPATVLNAIGDSWALRAFIMLDDHGYNGNESTFICHKTEINDHDLSIGESPDWIGCSFYTLLENYYQLCIDGLDTGIYYAFELRYTDWDGMARVYLNGALRDEIYIGHNPLSYKADLYLGKGMFGNENRPWRGKIDNLEFLRLEE